MTQAELIKLHALLSKLQLAISNISQIDSSFERDYGTSLQQVKDFSDQLNHFEAALKATRVIPYTFLEAN